MEKRTYNIASENFERLFTRVKLTRDQRDAARWYCTMHEQSAEIGEYFTSNYAKELMPQKRYIECQVGLDGRIVAKKALAEVRSHLDEEASACLDAFVLDNVLAAEIGERLGILPRSVTEAVRFALDTINCLLSGKPTAQRACRPGRHTRTIVTPDGEFASIKDAAAKYGVTPQAVQQKVSRGRNGWAYRD